MTTVEAAKGIVRGPRIWPLSVKAYHALGDSGLLPEKTVVLLMTAGPNTPAPPNS
jgi:hypothetical protein